MKIFGTFILIIFVGVMTLFIYQRIGEDFNPKKWSESDLVTKYRMALTLSNDNILIGKSREEVLGLLGLPNSDAQNYLYYQLDQPWGFKK